MKQIRLKVLLFIATIFVITLISKIELGNEVYADNPNQKTTMSHLTGGWDQVTLGKGGYHWTRYWQYPQGGKLVMASIQISGKNQEVGVGDTTNAYKKSQHKVGPYEPHKHGGGSI